MLAVARLFARVFLRKLYKAHVVAALRRADTHLFVQILKQKLLKQLACAEGDELCAVLAALMDMRDAGVLAEYTYTPTRDMSMGLFDLGAGVEYLVLHDSRARLVLDCLKRNGCHGTCRKAGTDKTFEF